ncbi:Ser/Thr protein phosphatase family protein [Alkalibacterium sp. AK22]|uniref:metallophosphoesterase n=1 Tax=Alkalibacterium sp. AK22 TaxID=1229520 RepID=UPI000452287E|nr:metallophosphoesterase [Alkalibacterium sp. AK22]EXJ23109.1 Ser/Thr protein phosphatase family protein [Alkalibacterium sp. AK22]
MIWIVVSLLITACVYLYVQNYLIEVSEYEITVPKLAAAIKGKRIVHLTDLHLRSKTNKSYVETVISKTKAQQPDMILLTGDLVQAGMKDLNDTLLKHFAELCSQIAPTYAVTGNHDIGSGKQDQFKEILTKAGVRLLDNEAEVLRGTDGKESLVLMGLSESRNRTNLPKPALKHIELSADMERLPKILLAHRPEYFEEYMDDRTKAPALVLSGHTHAGQVRVPYFGGLFAPGQGLLPQYDYGVFVYKTDRLRKMVVSRGLGNSTFPVRVNNRPEIVSITLK